MCILTHDPKFDVPAVQGALGTSVGYIGVMGSRKTHATRLERLAEVGVDRPQQLSRLMSPIGLDIGARTPEETAVSIIAEIIEIRPVDNNRLRAKCAQFSHQLVEIGFTVKAAASIVRGEGGYCELVGFNQLMARADFFRDTCCSFQLDCGERRGNCRDPDGGISELIVGDFQDEGAVDPTGVRDQYGIHSRKNLAQMKKLVFE